MVTALVVVIAALVGAFARAAASEQTTWSWRTIVDTAMGGLGALAFYVVLQILPWTAPMMAKLDLPWEQVVVVAPFSYVASHVYTNRGADWLAAIGDRWFRGPAA